MTERKRIVIDPVTRIEGHLRIELKVEAGRATDAWSSGTMARGLEQMLVGRHPFDAPWVTSRICGVCFSVHQFASLQALESAAGAALPRGATLLRNLVMAAEYLYDHLLHFYQLSAPDYLDLSAVAAYAGDQPALGTLRDRIRALAEAGDTAPFTPRYPPDEYCISDPETVTTLLAHYVEALDTNALARQMGALLGGRAPHYQSLVPGGFSQYPTPEALARFEEMLHRVTTFVRKVYLPDVLALARGPLQSVAHSDHGVGHGNFLACGAFPEAGEDGAALFPAGVIRGGSPSGDGAAPERSAAEPFDPDEVTESVAHAWYAPGDPVHPSTGDQRFDPDREGAYSFVKAPRYRGQPMEVGPLARMLVAGDPDLTALLREGMRPGTVARHAARALETVRMAEASHRWLALLRDELKGGELKLESPLLRNPPREGRGAGFYEAPRGALGHWIHIEDGRIAAYQAVVPTTWNGSPRDEQGIRGPFEEALVGCPVPDEDHPLHAARIVRSFDPCMACAIH